MQLLDEILAKTHELTLQQVAVEDAENVAKQAKQAADRVYSFMRSCEAMVPVSDAEIADALAEYGALQLIRMGVLRVNHGEFRKRFT